MIIIKVLSAIIGMYILFYSAYWFLLTIIGKQKNSKDVSKANIFNPELLIILPAYKPGPVFFQVLDAVEKAIESRNGNVFVLLQDAEPAFYSYAQNKGFIVVEKSFANLPGNSYQHALRFIAHTISKKRLEKLWNPEFVMLVDKDNLIDPDFFSHITPYHYDRFDIIQGKRSALSTNSEIAFFDSLTEKLNDTLYRTAKERMKLMIEISGSGALIETDLFLRCINKLDTKAPGFDKNFMVQLLNEKRDVATTFLPACTLWEEKTSSLDAHNPQRVRWFGEQYYNAIYHAKTLIQSAVINKRPEALDYLITLCRPPRSLQLVLTPLAGFIEIIHFLWTGSWFAWFPFFTASAILTTGAVVIFLISNNAITRAFHSLQALLRLAFNNFFNASKSIKKENLGTFIHTSHKL